LKDEPHDPQTCGRASRVCTIATNQIATEAIVTAEIATEELQHWNDNMPNDIPPIATFIIAIGK
jgi:hypothetical protein